MKKKTVSKSEHSMPVKQKPVMVNTKTERQERDRQGTRTSGQRNGRY